MQCQASGMECNVQTSQHSSRKHALDINRAPRTAGVPPKPASNNDCTHEKFRDAPTHVSHDIHRLHQEAPCSAMPPGRNAISTPCNTGHAGTRAQTLDNHKASRNTPVPPMPASNTRAQTLDMPETARTLPTLKQCCQRTWPPMQLIYLQRSIRS